jgi:hypothetical protein
MNSFAFTARNSFDHEFLTGYRYFNVLLLRYNFFAQPYFASRNPFFMHAKNFA